MKGKVLVQGLVLLTSLMMLSATHVLAQDFCQGDFNYNGSVAAEDVTIFLENFGRSPFFNPCPPDGPAPISKSGQGVSYEDGDNGDLETGVAWPNPRFTDNLNGTATDNLTGLMWLIDANCISTNYPGFDNDGLVDGSVTWQHALDFVEGVNTETYSLCGTGHTDWRLPHIKELQSLADFSDTSPALPSGHPFTNVQLDVYWSSTTFAPISSRAWYMSMDDCSAYSDKKNSFFSFVWPVRGGHFSDVDNDGIPCLQPTDCTSGYCVEGVCCNSPCDGLCESCRNSATGALDGSCFPIIAGTDPYDECVDPETCDGFGGCANP